jgi:histidine decarboxylase
MSSSTSTPAADGPRPIPPLPPAAAARIASFIKETGVAASSFVGYPCSQDFEYPEIIPLLRYAMNNCGDPFAESLYRENTFAFEQEVVKFFQKHLRAPDGQTWGYATSGGTEGNLYGLYLARELYPTGVVYYSEHTHYSAAKIVRVLGARSIMIRGREDGEIDYEDLRETMKIHRDVPPIIMANIGTTMHGAVDDLAKIKAMLKELAITRFYIHADAALSGMILPWVDDPQPFGFDSGVDSISVSGHKFLGSPMPSGIVLARQSHVDRVARSVEYVGCMDTTIAGSRNGISPLILWSAIQRWGEEGLRRRTRACIETADYCIERFKAAGVKAWRHRNSVTVVIPRPGPEVVNRWQIAPNRDMAHIITMPHVTRPMIDAVVADVVASLKPSAA